MNFTTLSLVSFLTASLLASDSNQVQDPTDTIESVRQEVLTTKTVDPAEWEPLSQKSPFIGFASSRIYQEPSARYFAALGEGQHAEVYKVTLATDRPGSGLKMGAQIALRTADYKEYNEKVAAWITIRNFSLVHDVNQRCIKFYPELYGVFRSMMPKSFHYSSRAVLCQEMELIPMTLHSAFNVWVLGSGRFPDGQPIPTSDAFIFQWCLGEWAT